MLSWLTGKSRPGDSKHPLGSDASIDEAIAELNPGRPEANLIEIADWIGTPEPMAAAMPAEGVFRALTRLDLAAQRFLPEVWKQFLANNALDHIGEQKLKSLDTYYAAAFVANRHALQLLIQKPALGGKVPAEAASQMAARMLRAQVARARILHLRYRAPDEAWWTSAAEALGLVGQTAALNLRQRAYPDDELPTSPWVEHLLGLFFETAPLGNCNPRQMDLLARVLRWLEPHFMVRDVFSAQSPFLTRLDARSAPRRLTEPAPADPGNIYFGPGMAYGHLVRLRATLKSEGSLPVWMKDSQCTLEQALGIVDALIMHWSERPPQRMANRQAHEAAIRVINGFVQIRRMVAFSDFARSGKQIGYKSNFEQLKFERRGFADVTAVADAENEVRNVAGSPLETIETLETAGDKQLMDDWQMQDVSKTGVGATAMFLKPWMVIGAFLGYRLTDQVDWRVGIIRRIHRKPTGHPSIGIESFPELPICAQVAELRVPPGSTPQYEMARTQQQHQSEDAIVLSQARGLVLVPCGLFAAGKFLVLSVGGHREAVRMVAQVHTNEDCECIQYEVLES